MSDLLANLNPQPLAAVPLPPQPALILAGRQDATVGYLDALKLTENYPRGTFAILDRAGHGLEVEQETLFNSLVEEWLDRVAEGQKK